MMTNWALEITRMDGRNHEPKFSHIPSDTTPAEEMQTFLYVMDKIHAPHHEITPGVHAVHLADADQVWRVRVVAVGDPDETQEFEAVELDTIDQSK